MDPSATVSPPERAAAAYRGEAGQVYHEGKRGLPERAVPWVHRLRAAKFARWVGSRDAVFELGVGAGWNLAALRCGPRVGCDAADAASVREALRSLGIGFEPSLASVTAGWADVVICHHTLEHLPDPIVALGELRRILKPGGRLIVHVPWEREWRYARFNPKEPNHHLHGWNAQSLGNLVQVLGWRVETIGVRRYGYDRFAARWAVRLGLGETGFRALRASLIALRPLREVELVAVPAD